MTGLTTGGKPGKLSEEALAAVTGGANSVAGTSNDDNLTGTLGADIIDAGNAQDRINARGGDDVVLAGEGDDKARGGLGHDVIYGGGGQDQIFGNAGNDELNGDDGNDTLVGGTGLDGISGGTGQDLVLWRPGDGNDTVDGGQGDDTLRLELTPAQLDRYFGVGYEPGGLPSNAATAFEDAFEAAPGSQVTTPTFHGDHVDVKGFSGWLTIGQERIFITNMERVEFRMPPAQDDAYRSETT